MSDQIIPDANSQRSSPSTLVFWKVCSALPRGKSSRDAAATRDVEGICTKTREMTRVHELAELAARNEMNVLIEGESGVGKGVVAEHIHLSSERRDTPLVKVNCAAIPESLFEAECFGFNRGAFTGATNDRAGYFESAGNGTIVLDEISEIPYQLQAKLLHVLDDHVVYRVGSNDRVALKARILSTTNRRLRDMVRNGQFRLDLYFRLAETVIVVPPLRRRQDDIELLARHFLRKYCGNRKSLSRELVRRMMKYDWPGNVRELEASLCRAVQCSLDKEVITTSDLTFDFGSEDFQVDVKHGAILEALRQCSGNVVEAAKRLGWHRNTLYYHARNLGIDVDNERKTILLAKIEKGS